MILTNNTPYDSLKALVCLRENAKERFINIDDDHNYLGFTDKKLAEQFSDCLALFGIKERGLPKKRVFRWLDSNYTLSLTKNEFKILEELTSDKFKKEKINRENDLKRLVVIVDDYKGAQSSDIETLQSCDMETFSKEDQSSDMEISKEDQPSVMAPQCDDLETFYNEL